MSKYYIRYILLVLITMYSIVTQNTWALTLNIIMFIQLLTSIAADELIKAQQEYIKILKEYQNNHKKEK
jgi:hypothetical protein